MDTDNQVVPADTGGSVSATKGDLKERAVKRGNEMWYHASQLRPRGHNVRQWHLPRNKRRIIEFAQTAYKGGIRVPLNVSLEDGKVVIDQGETRWLAVKLLEGDDIHNALEGQTDPEILSLLGVLVPDKFLIPAVPSSKKLNKRDLLRDTVITNTGQSLHDLELADLIKQCEDWGWTQAEIAEEFGGKAANWTQARVSHIRQLCDAPPRLRELLGNEIIATTTVIEALRLHGDNAEEVVFAAIEDSKTSAAIAVEQHEREAREAEAEAKRLIASGEADTPVSDGEEISKIELAKRRATEAAEMAEAAKKVAESGPTRVTGREVHQAAARRKPDAPGVVALSRSAQAAFVAAVRVEAEQCPYEPTRKRMNDLLKLYGFPEMEPRVDIEGGDQSGDADAVAAA